MNFTETTNPDNRFKFIKEDQYKEIVVGSDCTHTFEFEFDYFSAISSALVLYKQGLTKTFTFSINNETDVYFDELNNKSYVNLHLSPEDTAQFTNTNLDTYVQLKFILFNGDIVFSDKYKVIVKEPIKQLLQ